jgi:hypothetical protein
VFGGRCNLKDCRLVARFCGKVEEDVAAVTELQCGRGCPRVLPQLKLITAAAEPVSCVCVFCGLHGFIVANGCHSALLVTK